MKEIKLTCSFDSQICNFFNSEQKIEINNPFENDFSLEINNSSLKNCQLYLQADGLGLNNQADKIKLLITKNEKIIYQASLDEFFKQKINLDILQSQSANKYFFIFDLSHLFFIPDKIEINFDLLFDFDCTNMKMKIKDSIQQSELPQTIITENSGEVLADNNQKQTFPFFLSLSILFVFLLFVIIKIVHGKKKKK